MTATLAKVANGLARERFLAGEDISGLDLAANLRKG
jgi:hypothetical protein